VVSTRRTRKKIWRHTSAGYLQSAAGRAGSSLLRNTMLAVCLQCREAVARRPQPHFNSGKKEGPVNLEVMCDSTSTT